VFVDCLTRHNAPPSAGGFRVCLTCVSWTQLTQVGVTGDLPLLERYRYFLHVTLTIDVKNFHSQYDAKRSVERIWNSLLTRLRKRCRIRNEYIHVLPPSALPN